ncbi:MAG: chromosome partitioning protein [Gammaproteobacteria bacterium]|jgi:chromosome partitioning protein
MTMRRIALVNQKGGVGKTTTAVNLGAALALAGRRVVLVDLDPQGNLSTHLDIEVPAGEPSTYRVLCDGMDFGDALRDTATPGLRVSPTNIDLSGAEMELAAAIGRESILNDAIDAWATAHEEQHGEQPADYVIVDCPPSLGLLSVNGLVASREVFIALQTEFFALQGMSKLVEIVQLLQRRLQPKLAITGIIPCLYDSRLRLAREVLAEIRKYFPGPVFNRSIRKSVKLAEAPSYGESIFQYAPKSPGAGDYAELAAEVLAQEPGAVPVGTPVAKAPVAKAPVAKAPVAKAPVAKAPVAKAPVAKAPVAEAPVAKAPQEPTTQSVNLEPAPQTLVPAIQNQPTEQEHTLVPAPVVPEVDPKAEAQSEMEQAQQPEPSAPANQPYTDEGTVTAPRRSAPLASELPPLPESAFRIVEP